MNTKPTSRCIKGEEFTLLYLKRRESKLQKATFVQRVGDLAELAEKRAGVRINLGIMQI